MKNYFYIIFIFLLILSCSKEKDFKKEEAIILDWIFAIKENNYDLYKKRVAYPKNINTFKVMYQDYYIEYIKIIKIDEYTDKVFKDVEGRKYYKKKLYFNGKIKMRNQTDKDMLLKADVLLIQFLDGERKNDGWLISNRTFLRIPLN